MATQADLDRVNQAIADLEDGKRVERISFSNGESVQYAAISHSNLLNRRAEIQKSLSASRSFVKIVSRKGL